MNKTLCFKSLCNELPDVGREVLIKYKDLQGGVGFYVCNVCISDEDKSKIVFEEALGEQYVQWDSEDVIGWMYSEDLNML